MGVSQEIRASIESIRQRVIMLRQTDEAAEWLARNGFWCEVLRARDGWLVRVTRKTVERTRLVASVEAAIEAAREMARL